MKIFNRPTTKYYLIDGNPYINSKNFETVKITGYNLNLENLRYNAYEDEMEFKVGEQLYYTKKVEGLVIDIPNLKKTYQIFN